MVEIHLLAHGSEVPFLSIPLADVQRLSIRPFKWLRFVLFAICGTAGELSATPGGKPVDYESTKLGVDAIYYFKPSGKFRVVCGIVSYHSQGEFIFVDLDGLNDEVTLSTDSSGCCTDFRKNIMERDRFCVVTQEYAEDCDAAHLIPSTKGDDVSFIDILHGLLMTVYYSTFRRLFEIALPSMAPLLQFLGLMQLKMESF